MRIDGKRVLVVGATGTVGGLAAQRLTRLGASAALAGRDRKRLAGVSEALGGRPHRVFEAYDLSACEGLAPWAAEALGGLDAVVVALGTAGFGAARDMPEAAAEHLVAVNALAPMAVVRGALRVLPPGSAVCAVTGVVVDRPPSGTADYAAAKSALAAWLGVAARESRRAGVAVLDVRMPHLDNGFAERAVVGTPPPLPAGAAAADAVESHLVAPLLERLGSGGPARAGRAGAGEGAGR
ncbi:SDR family NAD(P)-dependent oxidoreductase [Streptomyces sp. NPDC013012]|uniref:SDR family NAD(P)-dependent oxidoreductase n=1 Tax=Streptomyces sp. NPDC013012 TaxID=3364860 RepID=UPI0036764766